VKSFAKGLVQDQPKSSHACCASPLRGTAFGTLTLKRQAVLMMETTHAGNCDSLAWSNNSSSLGESEKPKFFNADELIEGTGASGVENAATTVRMVTSTYIHSRKKPKIPYPARPLW
jgi:hypothetical protein